MIQLELFNPFEYTTDCNKKQEKVSNIVKGSFFGLGLYSGAILSGKYGIPRLKPYYDSIPNSFITYSECTTTKDYSCGLASFDDDLFLERVWNNYNRYSSTFSKFHCVGEPDFSLKLEYPLAVQIANTYRNHALAYRMQESEIKIIPSPSWSSKESYEFCFDGYGKGGAVLISTIGTLRDERSRMYFKLGFGEMLKRLSPEAVVLYGDINDSLMKWFPKQLHICQVKHNRFVRARSHGSKRRI
ncbi:MAG: DUF4417 domain-containing protein [Marinilabiliaceae bacterium]|nr:DUF4417 domain-containing protein [Marinilabiliaceae bacterium]